MLGLILNGLTDDVVQGVINKEGFEPDQLIVELSRLYNEKCNDNPRITINMIEGDLRKDFTALNTVYGNSFLTSAKNMRICYFSYTADKAILDKLRLKPS